MSPRHGLLIGVCLAGCPASQDSGVDDGEGESTDTTRSTDTTDTADGTSTADTADSVDTDTVDSTDTDSGDPPDTGPELSVAVVAEDVAAAKLLGAEDDIAVITYADLAMAAAGDVDGDGVGEVVVNLPGREIGGYAGSYFVVSGTVRGTADFGAVGAAIYNPDDDGGPGDAGFLGLAAASAGDVDGDGLDELLVADLSHDADASTEAYPGAVFLFDGPLSGEVPLTSATATLIGMERDPDEALPSSSTGEYLAPLGDADGDGYDDVVISSNYGDGSAIGAIFVVKGPMVGDIALGTDSAMRLFPEDSDHVKAGAAAGDVDADGFDDLVAIQPDAEIGAVLLFSGSTTGDVYPSDADTAFSATTDDAIVGYGAHGVGDLNEDGYDDLVVMDSEDDTGGTWAGAIAIHLGPFGAAEDLGTGDSSYTGSEYSNAYECVNAGDIDGDGRDDIAIGASAGMRGGTGTVWVDLGPIRSGTGSVEDANIRIEGSDQDNFGSQLAAAGDVDLDGLADLWVSAPGDEEGGESSGAVFLILGSSLR